MSLFEIITSLFFSAVVIVGFAALIYFANKRLLDIYKDRPHHQFRRQLIMVGIVLVGILMMILLIPINGETRGQLLSLYGIIISATIALSSTTLVGNVMAGIMLRTVSNFKPGDYIRVGEYFGRVSEMDLMHMEIQTEERDLTTLPNLFMVTNPVRVMRTSGTILSVEVSLGYDVSRHQIERLLLAAANDCELESPYVQIRELGDFSVTYAVSALLGDLKQLIAKRRELRAATLDHLHRADIEIASPTLMSTRAFVTEHAFIPEDEDDNADAPENVQTPDSLVFDKAEQAESVAALREKMAALNTKLKECDEAVAKTKDAAKNDAAKAERDKIATRIERLQALIDRREADISSQT